MFDGGAFRRAIFAALNDTPSHLIQRQLRHKKFDSTAGHIQAAELHRKNAAGMASLKRLALHRSQCVSSKRRPH
jgi:hypothetical protein